MGLRGSRRLASLSLLRNRALTVEKLRIPLRVSWIPLFEDRFRRSLPCALAAVSQQHAQTVWIFVHRKFRSLPVFPVESNFFSRSSVVSFVCGTRLNVRFEPFRYVLGPSCSYIQFFF